MQNVKSDFLRVMMERGFFHQCSDLEGLDQKLQSETVSAYLGFDLTAKSFHVGNLVQIMRLYWLQQTGHRPIVLMGGGTTRVGDPSGKDETRKLLSPEQIAENKDSMKRTFSHFLRFGEGRTDAVMVDNDEWLRGLNYIDMLRDVGRHFSVNRMLTMDTVRLRLEREQELSFLEFNYMVLQAYDFVQLNQRYGCILQMGGSDQWGNIIMGVDLGRRMGTPQLYCLTSPLITTADGAKMGKTAKGAVWLNPDMLSAYDFWQFWRNAADADVGMFLKLFTTMPLAEIARLETLRDTEINEAKKFSRPKSPRWSTAARRRRPPRKPPASPSRKAAPPRPCRPSPWSARGSSRGLACWMRSSRRGWSPRPARRGGRSRAGGCGSMTSGWTMSPPRSPPAI